MSYSDEPISQFLATIASENVTPAGGTAAALAGATGASLCEMACIHTIEWDDNTDADSELTDIGSDLKTQREQLLALADRDADAIDELMAASDENAIQAGAKRATGVPLAIAEGCLTVIDHATVVTEKSSPNVVPDATTGVFLAQAALRSSVFIVRRNVGQISDSSFVEEMELRTTEIEDSAETSVKQVRRVVSDSY